MEILFWKVFHNQYLVNKIFHFIHTIEWVDYKQVKQIHVNNRILFKDLTKLDWFLKNGQYTLLQYKLKKNENIIIDQESVEALFTGLKIEGEKEVVDGSGSDQETEQYQILYEILIDLLNNKRNQIEICDLTKVAVKCNNFKIFNLLINEPYSVQVYPSTLEIAIEFSNCKLFQMVLDILKSNYGKIIISDELKERSLQLASKNIGQYEEMIQFILSYDNGVLYNDKPTLSPIEDENKKIDFKVFMSLKSYKVKNRLVELDVISRKVNSNRLLPSIDIKSTVSYEALAFSIRVNCKYYYSIGIESKLKSIDEMENQTEAEKIKLLHKLIITQIYPSGYIDYLILYNETINEQFKNNLFSNATSDEDTVPSTHPTDLCYSKNDGSDESKLMVLFRYICELKIRFIGSTDKNQFIEKMKESNQMVKQGKLKWYPILDSLINDSQSIHRVLHIKDKEILDWVAQSNNELIHFLVYHYSNRIRFETLELLEYAHSKECIADITIPLNGIHESPLLVLESSFRWHFINAVNQCDIKALKYIDSKELKFAGNHFDSALFVSESVELDRFLVLLNYLNQSNFKSFTFNTLTCFCNEIVGSVNLIKSESLQQIKMNLTSFPQDKLMEMIVNSTVAYFNMNLFQLLINSVESPILSNQQASRFTNTNKIFDKYSPSLFEYDFAEKHCLKVTQIVTILKLLVDKFNDPSLVTDSKTTYSIFINHFFKKLIRCKHVEFRTISELVQLFQDNLITISKDTYNSFYYLHIRNVKLSKYVVLRPGLSALLDEYSNGEGQPAGVNHSKFSKYLSPDVFTYEFIFGANQSFETILDQLIISISHCSIKDRCLVNRTGSYSIETFNYDLSYCLEIKRVDLFFKQLDFIGQQIKYSNLPDEKDYVCFQDKKFPIKSFIFNSPATSVLSKDNFFDKYDQILFKLPIHLLANGDQVVGNSKQQEEEEELEFKYPIIINSFSYTSKVMELVCQVLNVHQFKRFLCLDFNFHKFNFHYDLLCIAAKCFKWDIVVFILDNFSVNLFNISLNAPGVIDNYNEINLLVSRYFKLIDKPHQFQKKKQQHIEESFSTTFQHSLNKYFQLDSNIEKYNQFIDPTSTQLVRYELLHEALLSFDKSIYQIGNEQRDQLSNDKSKSLIEIFKQQSIQQLFKSILCQNNQNNLYSNDDESSLEINGDNGYNEFQMYFVRGNIQVCDLLLNKFPKHFKITTLMLSKAILRDNIHIINHYSNIINQDDELSEHLKYIISRHKDYGQINFSFKKSPSPLITQPSFFNSTYLFNVLLSYWNYFKSLFINN